MASSGFMHLLLFFLFAALASSASISNNVFESHGVTGRSLLQQKAACPVNFESQNYTIMTSQCKGPNYQASSCCGAFKQLACPFSQQLNDLKNDCASTLFSYINVYGKYPPGLFASLCREDQDGPSHHGIVHVQQQQPLASGLYELQLLPQFSSFELGEQAEALEDEIEVLLEALTGRRLAS
ncbi:hypothetical protein RJ639_016020 [Escallonia herrerae]|uniref:GPI-anchored protein LLG1-like domain-containing protein n=1 Tax=Escallonia herrerae TaxID=1293975 RepID=A0AA88VGN0_9ASTE|nr:hypothetical protein RJ639_016020 [Escallonia herrerae]